MNKDYIKTRWDDVRESYNNEQLSDAIDILSDLEFLNSEDQSENIHLIEQLIDMKEGI